MEYIDIFFIIYIMENNKIYKWWNIENFDLKEDKNEKRGYNFTYKKIR